MKEHSIYIGLGSNLGDRVAYLREAVHMLGAIMQIKKVSRLYVAAPLGYVRDDAYINAALHATTTATPIELLPQLLQAADDADQVQLYEPPSQVSHEQHG